MSRLNCPIGHSSCAFLALSQVNSRLSMIYFENGVACFNIKEFDEAEQSFSSAIAYNSKVAIYYAYRGQTRLILENFETASEVRDSADLCCGRLSI